MAAPPRLLPIEAEPAPENHSYQLRRFQPDRVILIDAVQMDLAPGDIRLIDLNAINGFGASTHTTPLALFAQYIRAELGCETLLIGIQPGDTTLGAPLTPEVKAAVRRERRVASGGFWLTRVRMTCVVGRTRRVGRVWEPISTTQPRSMMPIRLRNRA